MRLGIIAAAPPVGGADPEIGERDAMLMSSRLAIADLGFEIFEVNPAEDLAEQLDQQLAERQPDEVLFYASSLLAMVDDGECFLCLNPAEPDVGDSLRDVATVILDHVTTAAALVLDLRFDDGGADQAALTTVANALQGCVADAIGAELIAAIRPVGAHPERIPSRLTAALLEAIDSHTGEMTVHQAYAAAVQRSEVHDWPSAMCHRRADRPFFLRRPEAPPSVAAARASERPREAPPARQPLPSAEPIPLSRPSGAGSSAADVPQVVPPPPPAPQPPSPEEIGRAQRRPPPPSERKEAHSVALPAHRKPSAPVTQPKVVLGPRTSAPPGDEPAYEDSDPGSDGYDDAHEAKPSTQPGHASPHDDKVLGSTVAEGPAAKRMKQAADEAIAAVSSSQVPTPRIDRLSDTSSPATAPATPWPDDAPLPSTEPDTLPRGDRGAQPAASEPVAEADHPEPSEAAPTTRQSPVDPSERPADESDTFPTDISVEVPLSGDISEEVSVEEEISLELAPEPPPPPTIRKKLSDMTVADHIEAGDLERDLGRLDDAINHYKKGLAKLGTAATPERAEIYIRQASVLLRQGKRRLAASNFDKALSIVPEDLVALRGLIDIEVAERNWRKVHSAEDKYFTVAPDDDEKVAILVTSGVRWLDVARDKKRARERFMAAIDIAPDSREALEGLLKIYVAEGALEQALEMRRKIAALAEEPKERARNFYELGELLLFEMQREDEAYQAFEAALEADPTMLEALEVLASALAENQEWAHLERVYANMIEQFVSRDDDEAHTVLAELHRRTALLHRDHFADPASALEALDRELALRPHAVAAHSLAVDLALEIDDGERALEGLRAIVALEPDRDQTYHDIFGIGQRYDVPDISFYAAAVTLVRGCQDEREGIIYREHKSDVVPPHRHALGAGSWELLKVRQRDPAVDAVMRAVTPSVVRARVKQLIHDGTLPDLPDTARQDPATSTVSAVRSLNWAGQLLAVPLPAVYVRDDVDCAYAARFARFPATLIGRDAMRGRTTLELGFMAGRHLALRLPEHELVAHLSSIDELSICFLAALRIVLGRAPVSGQHAKAVDALAKVLGSQQTPEERDELIAAVDAFSEAGGRVNLRDWLVAASLCAGRAGLLMCGDLEVSLAMIEAAPGFATVEQHKTDLCAFAVSKDYETLRDQLGSRNV